MATPVDKVAAEALKLSGDGRALLVETLLESLAGETTPAAERAHLVEVRRRREAVRAGKSELLEGNQALRRARTALGR